MTYKSVLTLDVQMTEEEKQALSLKQVKEQNIERMDATGNIIAPPDLEQRALDAYPGLRERIKEKNDVVILYNPYMEKLLAAFW